jgi:hypothetical protein
MGLGKIQRLMPMNPDQFSRFEQTDGFVGGGRRYISHS